MLLPWSLPGCRPPPACLSPTPQIRALLERRLQEAATAAAAGGGKKKKGSKQGGGATQQEQLAAALRALTAVSPAELTATAAELAQQGALAQATPARVKALAQRLAAPDGGAAGGRRAYRFPPPPWLQQEGPGAGTARGQSRQAPHQAAAGKGVVVQVDTASPGSITSHLHSSLLELDGPAMKQQARNAWAESGGACLQAVARVAGCCPHTPLCCTRRCPAAPGGAHFRLPLPYRQPSHHPLPPPRCSKRSWSSGCRP